MKTIYSKIKLSIILAFLKKYRILIFWLAWGIFMNLIFDSLLSDLQTFEYLFVGIGILMGVSHQFVKIIWLRRIAMLVSTIVFVLVFGSLWVSLGQIILNQKISHDFLVDDVRQLFWNLLTLTPTNAAVARLLFTGRCRI